MSFGPWAIARAGGTTVMIPGAVPGDRLEVEIRSAKRDYARGSVVRVLEAAAERREPPCPYAAECGGCDWQHIRYDGQARFKADVLAAEFRHALGVELDRGELIEAAPQEFRYRSRVRLKTSAGGKIGFHHPRSNQFVAVEDCLVAASSLTGASNLAAALGRNCTEIEIVEGLGGDVLIASLIRAPRESDRKIARELCGRGATGVILQSGAGREFFGTVRIAYVAEPDCAIEADADVFSQVNPQQNPKLVAAVMKLAELSPDAKVLDVFCGSGNFSLPAARRHAHVIGLDRDGLAIEAARANAARMGLKNTQFIAMSAVDGVRFLSQTGYHPDVLILDPPRAGAAALLPLMPRLNARKLIYVSCNLATLLRDLRELMVQGYEIQWVLGFDFFPNTHHIEIVASLLLT